MVQYWRSQFWSLHSLTVCLLYFIVVSILLEIVEIHQIDLQRGDDYLVVHFLIERVHLPCEFLSTSPLLWPLEPECR